VFQVIVSNRAKKSIKKYKKVQRSVLDLLITLQENPVPADHYDVKKIKGESARIEQNPNQSLKKFIKYNSYQLLKHLKKNKSR
jgi:hypothetical protein